MARSVVDLAIVLDATAGVDPADPTTIQGTASYLGAVDPNGLAGRRIGVVSFSGDPGVVKVEQAAIDEVRANGADVIEVVLPGGADIDPLFDEFRTSLDAYLAAQPGAPVHSLADIVALDLDLPAVVEPCLCERAAVTTLDTAAYQASLAGRDTWADPSPRQRSSPSRRATRRTPATGRSRPRRRQSGNRAARPGARNPV